MLKRLNTKYPVIFLLYIPWLLSILLQLSPGLSYFIAWLGSFWIFYITWFSPFRFLDTDFPRSQQIMRPIFLVQLIFAGFMCCTSIFYYLDQLGYHYLDKVTENFTFINTKQIALIAQCQRLSLLGHAALVSGMILASPQANQKSKFQLTERIHYDRFLIRLSVIAYFLGVIVQRIPAITQFSIGFTNVAIICGAFLLVRGFINNKFKLILVGGAIFVSNFINSTLLGYKEHILINFLIIGLLIYPYYKRLTLWLGIPILYMLFYILPTYVTVIRSQAWTGELTPEEARVEAVETLFNDTQNQKIEQTNWDFLINRLSEMDMFTQFVESTPQKVDYYGFEILKNSLYVIVPRFLWKNKPIVEVVSMERVYAAEVIDRNSIVSAKTRPVVDGYLSGGVLGVFISLFVYGWICQRICNQAESWFGGYQLGCVIIFNGLFQPLWRGNNFEFIINSVFYSYVLMLMVFVILRKTGILVRIPDENYSNQRLI